MTYDDFSDARDDQDDDAALEAHQEHEGFVEDCDFCGDERDEYDAMLREQSADGKLEALVSLFLIEPMTPLELEAARRDK